MERSTCENFVENMATTDNKDLSVEELYRLKQQNNRLVNEHKAKMLELEAKKHWDLFYKRNETRFFKDRHWTTREFGELLSENSVNEKRTLFEIGCGVGNFIYPLIEENLNFNIVACDLSPRAVEIVKSHRLYTPSIKVFQCDITTEDVFHEVPQNSLDIVTLIFVLSAIHPDKFSTTFKIIFQLLKPGGILLFRDYGLYDMAQLRFKAGHKISENFYMRQDGTRSYYFSVQFLKDMFDTCGFESSSICYIHRRTVNKKEHIDVPRIFVQAKAKRPIH